MSKQLKNDIKNSIIKTPWHIIRFLSFFSVLLPLCLPVLWAGHKNVSLITFIASIVNHGFDIKDFPNAYKMHENQMTLPLNTTLTDEDADYVIDTFIKVYNQLK